ncbi:hypothetical protein [Oleiharenicola sp. Vm1]|uniref:hypothetical protein n=1 Tax=Oleiharenicola sp. Vm1 TaxID=3398393 RepID=UPI0039F4BF64
MSALERTTNCRGPVEVRPAEKEMLLSEYWKPLPGVTVNSRYSVASGLPVKVLLPSVAPPATQEPNANTPAVFELAERVFVAVKLENVRLFAVPPAEDRPEKVLTSSNA